MNIAEFLNSEDRLAVRSRPEVDALTEDRALDDAALFGVQLDMVRSTAVLLFDCRGALRISEGNTALLVLRELQTFSWNGLPAGSRIWRAVDGWCVTAQSDGTFRVATHFAFDESFQAELGEGEFYVGDVPGCDVAPPNFLEASDKEVRDGLQNWGSEFQVLSSSFRSRRL